MRILLLLALLCSGAAADTLAPPQAWRAGYRTLAFNDGFSSIDTANSQTGGFSWYIQNWFGVPATTLDNINVSSGLLTLGNGTGNAKLQTAISNGSGGYIGTVFGGGGYFEIEMAFDPASSVNAASYPAFFLEPIEHIEGVSHDLWPGQATGYEHFGEIDIAEIWHMPMQSIVGWDTYLTVVHDWSGVYGGGYPVNIENLGNDVASPSPAPTWLARNRYGVLWVPQNGNTSGSLTFYFNDQTVNTIYYAGPVTSPPLPGQSTQSYSPSTPAQAAQTYAVIDSEHFAMRIQTDQVWPIAVYSVKVWQK
jgi:hypothetical protein